MALLSSPVRVVVLALCATLGLLAASSTAEAKKIRQAGNFGIGLGVGFAGGISGKYFASNSFSLQGTVGNFGTFRGRSDGLAVGLDGLLEMPSFVRARDVELAWHIGAGGGFGIFDDRYFDDRLILGIQGVLGLQVLIVPVPVDIALELRPTILLVDEVDFDLFEAGLHVRYFF